MSFHTYSVFRDGSHTCICVAVERKYTYFIPMEAAEVRVAQLAHEEFKELYVLYEYPVRRAAEVYLNSPDKEVTPKAREHLEAILADPQYAYDSSQFPPLNVYKEKIMARKSAVAVADEIETKKPKNKKEALAAAAEVSSKPVGAQKAPKDHGPDGKAEPAPKVAPAKKAPKAADSEPKPKAARASALDTAQRFKLGNVEGVRGGFMKEFVECAAGLEKASRGKGFIGDALLEAAADLPGASGRDAAWVKTYLSYSAAPARGILVPA